MSAVKPSFSNSIVLITVILMDLLVGVEFDLFVPSFPELKRQFNLSPFWVEALLSVNFIGYFLSLFFVGDLADRLGRKPVILLGLGIFVFGSILCLWKGAYSFLLIGRFLQGIGIAAPAILSFLIIADTYPLKDQQRLLGILNGIMNASAGAAPVMGSYITLYFQWQGNFIVLLFLGLVVLLMVMFFIPAYQLPTQQEKRLERSYFSLFQSRPLMLLVTHFVFMFAPYWIFVGMSPLLYMKDFGVNLAHFGYYQGVLAFVFAIGSFLFGLVVHRFDQKKMLLFSNFILIAGLMGIAFLTFLDSKAPGLITMAVLVFCIGQIIPSTLLYPLCLNYIPHAKGRVSAIIQGARLIFSSLCLQIAGYFYSGSFQNIGFIMAGSILIAIITLFWITKNQALMNFSVSGNKHG